MKNRINHLFGIRFPLIQAGMVWCSGWELASAVSNSGCLGLIGAGSMSPEVLRTHIRRCKEVTVKPFGVNLPLLYPDIDKQINVILEEGVKIVFTSAGNPAIWTPILKQNGIIVVHVVSNTKFALKSEEAGVDAIVAEGFEAGGHNGREETTTVCLIPEVKRVVSVPLIAAGGFSGGRSVLAAMALGAEGVQMGSRFAASLESSAHINFKRAIIQAKEGDTQLVLKSLTPVRLIKNKFFTDIILAEQKGASLTELKQLLGKSRAKKGMFEGDLDEGELEIGQVSALLSEIKPAAMIINEVIAEYKQAKYELCNLEAGI